MPLAVHVKFDERAIKEAQHILRAIPRALPRVMRRAINRTVDTAATDLKRRIGKEINVKKGAIAKGIGKRNASNGRWEGYLFATYYRPSLTYFRDTRQTKRGVTYRIDLGGARKLIPHGFIADMESGYHGVFQRASHYPKYMHYLPMASNKKKEAIFTNKGPSIWHVAGNTPGLLDAIQTASGKKLTKHIDDQIGVELRRWEKR